MPTAGARRKPPSAHPPPPRRGGRRRRTRTRVPHAVCDAAKRTAGRVRTAGGREKTSGLDIEGGCTGRGPARAFCGPVEA